MLGVMNAATLPPNPPTRQTSDQALVADPHATGPEDVLEALGSSEKGLTADEASARLETYGPNALDRKSTRLNSSHVAISYAVFCLKKKKTKHIVNSKN